MNAESTSHPSPANPASPVSDEVLAGRAKASGDEPSRVAAAELLGRYRRRVYLWCYRYTREHEAAMDLAQDSLLRAYERLDSFRGDSRFSTWMFVLVRNTCLSAQRKLKNRPDLGSDGEAELDEIPDGRISPEEALLETEGEAALLEVIAATLDDTERRALWMRCVERLPLDTITQSLALTNATGARGLLQTARRKLRAALSRLDNDERPTS